MKKCIKRIIRLAIPVIGTAIFVYVIQETIGFYNFKIQNTIHNTWLTHLYGTQLTLRDIAKEPFRVFLLGSSRFNSPFWCLKDMLLVSLLIYMIEWIGKTTRKKCCILGIMTLCAMLIKREVIVACFIGSLAGSIKYQNEIKKMPRVVAVCGMLSPIIAFFTGNLLIIDITFATCLLCVPLISWVKKILETSFVKKIGSISFGIYALHWPVINSVGLGIICDLDNTISSAAEMILSLFGVLVTTFFLSILFKITIEKLTSIVCKKIY